MTQEELPELEKLFEVNIFVYTLESATDDGEEGEDEEENAKKEAKAEVAARLIFRSHRHYASTMYPNLHKKRFRLSKI